MSTQYTVVLDPTTSAAASESFFIGSFPCITVICDGLTGSETGIVQFRNPIDGSWSNLTQAGSTVQFDSTTPLLDVWNTAGTYRVSKSATASPVGVSVSKFY